MVERSLRNLLVEHALAMVEGGNADISLRAVARAADVSAMAPYRHFSDKAALMRSVARTGFDRLRDRLAAADLAEADPRDALIAQGTAYVAFAQAHPALFRLMFADPAGIDGQDACGGDAFAVLAERVASLAPRQPDVATVAAWSIVHGLATLLLDQRIRPDVDVIRETLRLFADGLCDT